MHEHLVRDAVPGRHQHRRPEDAVEADDVLADDVAGGGPIAVAKVLAGARVGERAQAVDERIGPDVGHLLRTHGI